MPAWLQHILDNSYQFPGIIFAFFIIFIVHELGHYFAARFFNMKIDHFSVGIGRKLWEIKDKHGTEWSFHLFPLGGHVVISDLTIMEDETEDRRPAWQRALVVLAGPFANLFFPFIAFLFCFLLIGYPLKPPVLSAVEEGLPAAQAGLLRGDVIQKVDGKDILSYTDFAKIVKHSDGEDLSIQVARNKETLNLTVTPVFDQHIEISGIERERYKIGVFNALFPFPLRFVHEVEGIPTKDNVELARTIIQSRLDEPVRVGIFGSDDKVHFYEMTFSSELNRHFEDPDHKYYDRIYLGPVKGNAFTVLDLHNAVKRAGDHWKTLLGFIVTVPLQIFPIDPQLFAQRVPFTGETYFYENLIYKALYTAALLSLVICFVNLLPFPGLDGDYLLYYLMESYMKKRPTRRQRAIGIGLILFSVYCVFLFANLEDLPDYLMRKAEAFSERFEK